MDFAKAHGFTPRILLVHEQDRQLRLSHERLSAYEEATRRIGGRAKAHRYRGKMIEYGAAPSRRRSGSHCLYANEFTDERWERHWSNADAVRTQPTLHLSLQAFSE